jgi:hypothetical protein
VTHSPEGFERYLADPTALIREQLMLDTGRPFGDTMAPFQDAFFRAIFSQDANGIPAYRLLYDERRRGESKTEDSAAAALADLLTGPPGHTSYAVAGDEDQAGLILDSVRGFRSRSPILADIDLQKSTVRNTATDSKLIVLSSDARTSYGLRPRKVFFDELSLQLDEHLWTSMWTALGKKATSQMIAVSMAGWDFSSLGWRIRKLAQETERYYFHTREDSELAPWLSERDMDEQRDTLHPSDFARYWECRWVEPKGSWITREMYEAVETGIESHSGVSGVRYAGFVDIGLVKDATAIAVCHKDPDSEVVVLDALRTLQGNKSMPVELEAIEDTVAELTERFNCLEWIFEAPQAVASVQRLQSRLGYATITARYPTVDTQARLFGTLYTLFSNRRLSLFPHERLRKEALSLVIKTVGGRLKVVDSGSVHQDHVIALGGAAEMVAGPEPFLGMILDDDEHTTIGGAGVPYMGSARSFFRVRSNYADGSVTTD